MTACDPKVTFVKLVTFCHDGAPSSNILVAHQDSYVACRPGRAHSEPNDK
jgi:hypothetical protein